MNKSNPLITQHRRLRIRSAERHTTIEDFVVAFDDDGNLRRGLVAQCRREDGSEHTVSAFEVALAEQSKGGHLIAAYRKWSGLDPWPARAPPPPQRKHQHKVAATDLDLSGPIELVVLSVKEQAARCRLVGSDRSRMNSAKGMQERYENNRRQDWPAKAMETK